MERSSVGGGEQICSLIGTAFYGWFKVKKNMLFFPRND